MSTATATATAATASYETTLTPETVRAVLAAYQDNPGSEVARQEALACRRDVAAQIAALPSAQKSGPGIERAREWIKLFGESGLADNAAETADLELARGYRSRGWPGLMAAMLLVPASQWPEAPALGDVATWLWPDYVAYVFYTPQTFTAVGQAEAFAAHALRRLEELARLAGTNPGSSAIRSALLVYRSTKTTTVLPFSRGSLRRHFELHDRILMLAAGRRTTERLEARFAIGRKLRLGFIAETFANDAAIQSLPWFEFLDTERFDVRVYVRHQGGNEIERYVASRAAELQVLPEGTEAAVDVLRAAELDVAVFGADFDGSGVVREIGAQRVAPLQIATNGFHTTGMKEVDLMVIGTDLYTPGMENDFSERLALVSGPGRATSPDGARHVARQPWTRTELGIPEQAPVAVVAGSASQLTPEVQSLLANILGRAPESWLVVDAVGSDERAMSVWRRWASDFERCLRRHGVADDRFTVTVLNPFVAASDRSIYAMADAVLAPFASREALDALANSVPVLATDGEDPRHRMNATILQSLGLGEWVAKPEERYIAIAAAFLTDANLRAGMRVRLEEKLARLPLVVDPLALSDVFGAIVDRAYSELSTLGADAFGQDRGPIRLDATVDVTALITQAIENFKAGREPDAILAAANVLGVQPTLPIARQIMGAAMLRADRLERATAYLLAAIQHDESNPGLWHDMAITLRRSGQTQTAIQALQTCVQLDPTHAERSDLLRTWQAEAAEAGAVKFPG